MIDRLKVLLHPFVFFYFHITKDDRIVLPTEPCLILANHTNFFDPLILMICLTTPICFAAEDHLYKNKVTAWFLRRLGCIPCKKGNRDVGAARTIIRTLRSGKSVCIFGERGITYDGMTAALYPPIAKLAKLADVTTVTIRIEGGYLCKPRWSYRLSRGSVRCSVRNIYSPKLLKQISTDRLMEKWERDLYWEEPCDGTQIPIYADWTPPISQKQKYRSAAGIYRVLFLCPCCKRQNSIQSHGASFKCVCGASGKITRQGNIVSDYFPFGTIWKWNLWQKSFVHRSPAGDPEIDISDLHATLYILSSGHKRKKAEAGPLHMSRRTLTCGGYEIPLNLIRYMDTRNKQIILFTTADGTYYELHLHGRCSALRYLYYYEALQKPGRT